MNNNTSTKINPVSLISLLCFLFISLESFADLSPLSDGALSDEALGQVSGQALFKIEETQSSFAGQEDISFTRMTLGLKIEMNVNIEEIALGTFYRQPGNSCDGTFTGRFCDNSVGDFSNWNCSESTCGGITDDHGENPFSASALVYGDLLGLSTAEVQAATWGSLTGDHYASSVMFTGDPDKNSADYFPSGFERTEGTDIKLRDVTFGRVIENSDGTQSLEDFVIEKPFIEFVHDDSSGIRKIAGLRVGFGSSTGTQGQAIDVVSGFIQPVINATASATLIGLSGTGEFTFAPYLGGVRTAGYIDPNKTIAGGCTPSGIIGGVVCGNVETAALIAEASPQAQLFPLQNLTLDDSPNVFLSIQSQDINYESDTRDGLTYNYETARAGVWFNLGALSIYEGGRQLGIDELTAATGISGNTSQPRHPDNYFAAHPNSLKYPQSNNYY
tara:strand:+ start:210 stop:1544 length:1335 start_codon:yes stop_codon:yes gene_type:complete